MCRPYDELEVSLPSHRNLTATVPTLLNAQGDDSDPASPDMLDGDMGSAVSDSDLAADGTSYATAGDHMDVPPTNTPRQSRAGRKIQNLPGLGIMLIKAFAVFLNIIL